MTFRPRHYLDTRQSSAWFHAITVHPGSSFGNNVYLRRGRILDRINQLPQTTSATIIMGPPGSGRTTLARQWVAELDAPAQVIYVRMPNDIDLDNCSPPSPFGNALADFLNAVAVPEQDIDLAHIKQLLDDALSLSKDFPAQVVIDDLEILSLGAAELVMPLLVDALRNYTGGQFLMVSRTFSTRIMNGLKSVGGVVAIIGSTLSFDSSESTTAQELGIFGNLSPDEVERARVENGGWISGMLNARSDNDSQTLSDDAIDDMVLNRIVQPQPTLLHYVLSAAAQVPSMSFQLWEFMVSRSTAASRSGGMLLSQLPVVTNQTGFKLARSLRESLTRLTNMITEAEKFKLFISDVLEWFITRSDLKSAAQLATHHNLESQYLRLVKPMAAKHARAEDWHLIAEMVETLPIDILTTDPDIPFWYCYALIESGQWSEMLHIHNKVTNMWSLSENDLLRGRDHHMKGWIARGDGEYKIALVEFEQAYHTLPAIAHQERMYASASADACISQLGPVAEPNIWRSRTAFELSHLPTKQRWWHSNIGPLTLGFLASSGKLDDAYQLARQQVADLEATGAPEFAWRYLLLMASIETERHRFESASAALERARPHIVSMIQENMLAVHESVLMAAKGNYQAAMGHLDVWPFSAGRSVNNEFRFKSNLASQNLVVGNISTANFLLNIAAWPHDPWPRNFGDPHPDLLRALILADGGDISQAISLAQGVLKESVIRQNRFIQICSHATLAHIYNVSCDPTSRDKEVEAAIAVNTNDEFQHAFNVLGQDVRTLSPDRFPSSASSPTPTTTELFEPTVDFSPLTPRENEVITYVSQGMANKDIASSMFISLSTVKNHLANIYSKLGVASRRNAVAKARSMGILDE